MFGNMKLAVKIGVGFTCAVLILAVAVGITYVQVTAINAMCRRIANLRVPTSEASLTMLNGTADFIQGMGKREEQFIILIDVGKILSVQEIAKVNKTRLYAPPA